MKIYSWNMLFSNRELDRAFAFIAQRDFDMFCLQEVPEKFLERLKTLSCYITSTPEITLRFNGIISIQYLVILSRYPLQDVIASVLPYREHLLPMRGKLFARLMFATGLWAEGLSDRHWLQATVELPAIGTVYIYNFRLMLSNLAWRAEEFETIIANRDSQYPAIICGDFNILEAPHITTLNWLLGGRVRDMLFYWRERNLFEERFVAHELINSLRGKVTHPFSHSQLDHILVSKSFSIQKAEVIPDRYGSDHHPIFVEVACHHANHVGVVA